METATDEPFTPIKQDIKKGQLRYLKHGNVLHNYGCFPQTWENPKEIHPATNLPGDGDPVDVIEIGSRNAVIGEVYPVKALGVLALIDEVTSVCKASVPYINLASRERRIGRLLLLQWMTLRPQTSMVRE